jgi:DNA-binding transcriptional ArsR family regulator
MEQIAVIEDAHTAEVSLHPVRARMLAELVGGDSATSLAAKLGLPRQRVNYHLRALEDCGLVELVEERRKRNMTERVMRATAASYVISPAALSAVAPDPDRAPDRLSAQWLLALAGRLVQELGVLLTRSQEAHQPLASFGLDTEITFADAAARSAFVAQLTDAVESLVARYHAGAEPGGRKHRLIVALHPSITRNLDGPEPEPDPPSDITDPRADAEEA